MSDYLEHTANAELFINASRKALLGENFEEALRLAKDAMHEIEQLTAMLEQKI